MEELAICGIHTHFSFSVLTAVFTDVRIVSLQLKCLGVLIGYTVNLNVIWHCGIEFFVYTVLVVYK